MKDNMFLSNGNRELIMKQKYFVRLIISLMNFCLRFKSMKWWAQSFIVGIPKIVVGYRDDDVRYLPMDFAKQFG